jgi:hypothetical protein
VLCAGGLVPQELWSGAGAGPVVRGNCLYGVVEVLLTPSGQSVRELYEGGALLGASARAWTSLACADSGCCAALADLRIIVCDPVVFARP